MARKEVIQFFDDLTGEALREGETEVIRFSLDKTDYVMDLSHDNAQKFREMIGPYIKVARKVTSSNKTPKIKPADVRAWAKGNGYDVSARGKIPSETYDAFRQANPSKA